MLPMNSSWPDMLSALAPAAAASVPSAGAAPSGTPFSGLLEQATRQMERLNDDASAKVEGLMVGDGTDVHTAMIATQKAGLAFDLALAVRNKAVAAYQQLMSMQF